MEIIRLSGYTNEEKLLIAKQHLVPGSSGNMAWMRKTIGFNDKGIRYVIAHYTREAGVRNLERQIAKVIRKVAVQ